MPKPERLSKWERARASIKLSREFESQRSDCSLMIEQISSQSYNSYERNPVEMQGSFYV